MAGAVEHQVDGADREVRGMNLDVVIAAGGEERFDVDTERIDEHEPCGVGRVGLREQPDDEPTEGVPDQQLRAGNPGLGQERPQVTDHARQGARRGERGAAGGQRGRLGVARR